MSYVRSALARTGAGEPQQWKVDREGVVLLVG